MAGAAVAGWGVAVGTPPVVVPPDAGSAVAVVSDDPQASKAKSVIARTASNNLFGLAIDRIFMVFLPCRN